MGIFSGRGNKNPLDSMKLSDLKRTEAQLRYQIQTLKKEKSALEKQITTIFSDSREITDDVETSVCAMQIKNTSDAWQSKSMTILNLERDAQVVSNIIAIKEQEKTLQRSGVMKKLQSIDPEILEEQLAKSSLDNTQHRAHTNDIAEITSEHISPYTSGAVDESSIQTLIAEMKESNSTPDSAVSKLLSGLSPKPE